MSEPAPSRLGRFAARAAKLPSEKDWERSTVLDPRPATRDPELISDGAGLPFPPSALTGSPQRLDADDPAVGALIAHLTPRTTSKRASRAPWKRAAPTPPPNPTAPPRLDGWRLLARTEGEALFGRGALPQLHTVAVREDPRRHTWMCIAASVGQPLRAARDGIRASSWRLEPSQEVEPDETMLRVLVTEQTYAGAQRAVGRVLAPDLHVDAEQLVLRMFVTPLKGFQSRAPNPETAVRVALPHPVGSRRFVDGALYEASSRQ
jgi:hypothetical protein